MAFSAETASRFWSKVDQQYGPTRPGELGPCWPWTRGRDKDGYGKVRIAGHDLRVHRVVYSVCTGPVPPAFCVLHRCDRPECCNPDHLFVGTVTDNNHDRHNKGRDASGDRNGTRLHPERLARGDRNGAKTHPETRARGDRNGTRTHPERLRRGEDNPATKLTVTAVQEIYRLSATGMNMGVIARKFGVSRSLVSQIHLRQVRKTATWPIV